ncbi:hypothetical protein [Roseococcus sp.]|uniref:hypothetical protein n=1 Tax=Roseococcus sp. TaxID=2109646 RepID=UPI003BACAACD
MGASVACAVFFAPIAEAQQVVLARYGYWTALRTVSSGTGVPMCVVAINNTHTGRSFYIKWARGDRFLMVQAFRTSWNIPRSAQIPIALQVDSNSAWTATAGNVDTMSNGISWTVAGNAMLRFIEQFRLGSRMVLRFPSGSEAPWDISLTGTNAILSTFTQCMRDITGTATQPFAPPAPVPTQPFSAPVPAQPFGPDTNPTPRPAPAPEPPPRKQQPAGANTI